MNAPSRERVLCLDPVLRNQDHTNSIADQPTYYHFHIHIVHVKLEQGMTQATGKALGLEHIINQLETMSGGDEAGMADVDLTYAVGEATELWSEIFLPLKQGVKS